MNNDQTLRRSQRLKNQKNGMNGSQLTGDKRYIFTHDFIEDNNKSKRRQIENINSNHNNNNHNNNSKNNSSLPSSSLNPNATKEEFKLYPTISRCKRKLRVVHHNPNVFIIENFLTENEINHVLNIAKTNSNKFETSYTQASAEDQVRIKINPFFLCKK